MGKYQREKGSRFERLVARQLGTERVGTRGKRDAEHADIAHDRFFVQCRHYARITAAKWFQDTAAAAEAAGKTPLLVIKQDYGEPLAVCRLDLLVDLLKVKGVR